MECESQITESPLEWPEELNCDTLPSYNPERKTPKCIHYEPPKPGNIMIKMYYIGILKVIEKKEEKKSEMYLVLCQVSFVHLFVHINIHIYIYMYI